MGENLTPTCHGAGILRVQDDCLGSRRSGRDAASREATPVFASTRSCGDSERTTSIRTSPSKRYRRPVWRRSVLPRFSSDVTISAFSPSRSGRLGACCLACTTSSIRRTGVSRGAWGGLRGQKLIRVTMVYECMSGRKGTPRDFSAHAGL